LNPLKLVLNIYLGFCLLHNVKKTITLSLNSTVYKMGIRTFEDCYKT
jgi:hypothetical protein